MVRKRPPSGAAIQHREWVERVSDAVCIGAGSVKSISTRAGHPPKCETDVRGVAVEVQVPPHFLGYGQLLCPRAFKMCRGRCMPSPILHTASFLWVARKRFFLREQNVTPVPSLHRSLHLFGERRRVVVDPWHGRICVRYAQALLVLGKGFHWNGGVARRFACFAKALVTSSALSASLCSAPSSTPLHVLFATGYSRFWSELCRVQSDALAPLRATARAAHDMCAGSTAGLLPAGGGGHAHRSSTGHDHAILRESASLTSQGCGWVHCFTSVRANSIGDFLTSCSSFVLVELRRVVVSDELAPLRFVVGFFSPRRRGYGYTPSISGRCGRCARRESWLGSRGARLQLQMPSRRATGRSRGLRRGPCTLFMSAR